MKLGRVLLVAVVAVLMVSAATTSFAVDRSPVRGPGVIAPRDFVSPGDYVLPNRAAWSSELDEPIGDTLVVGNTTYDYQHNSTVGRMVGYDPTGNDGNGAVSMSYMYQDGGGRHVHFNRVLIDADGNLGYDENLNPIGVAVSLHASAGYTTLGMNPVATGNAPITAFHGPTPTSGGLYYVWLAVESGFIPGFFNQWYSPPSDVDMDWPRVAVDNNNVVHYAAQDYESADNESYYQRVAYDPAGATFSVTTTGGEYMLVGAANGISYDVAVGPNGDRVVVGMPVSRFRFNNDYDETHLSDCDLLVWDNNSGGDNFDFSFAAATNVTQFQGPNTDLLPDTTAADVDTFRLWLDNNLYLDGDNTLHAAFPASYYSYLANQGTVEARLFYWNEVQDYYVQIADGYFFNNASPGANSVMLDRPNLYKDPTTGVTWCIWRQFGEPGDTTDTGQALDTGSGGHPNSDIYISASPAGEYNGLLWYAPINITDTRTMQAELPVGDSRCERDPSIALNNDGDYLNVYYLLDFDGGTFIQGEGSETLCEMVYQRVPKQQLLDDFEARPLEDRFTDPYPLHVDSTGFWDPTGAVGGEPQTLRPEQFELEAVYPNPFNSTARVAFRLQNRGQVQLTVYDMLGREVATLVNREMDAGRHEVSFLADDIASGVYFVALQSGTSRAVQKVALVR